jgi:hypothetical protein
MSKKNGFSAKKSKNAVFCAATVLNGRRQQRAITAGKKARADFAFRQWNMGQCLDTVPRQANKRDMVFVEADAVASCYFVPCIDNGLGAMRFVD